MHSGRSFGVLVASSMAMSDASQHFQLAKSSGFVLEVNGFTPASQVQKPVVLRTWNGNENQKWQVNGGNSAAIVWESHTDHCLEPAFGNGDNGAIVQFNTCNGQSYQQWSTPGPGQTGLIQNAQTGKCVDLKDGSITQGATIQMYDCYSNANQLWTLVADFTLPRKSSTIENQAQSWDYIGMPCLDRQPPATPLTCQQCAGIPTTPASGCTQKGGADLHGGSEADCQDLAAGNDVDCSRFGSHAKECNVAKSACANGTCNTYSIFFHPSCHTDPLGSDPAYNFCYFWQCSSNAQAAANLDGHCGESAGCQGTFKTYTSLSFMDSEVRDCQGSLKATCPPQDGCAFRGSFGCYWQCSALHSEQDCAYGAQWCQWKGSSCVETPCDQLDASACMNAGYCAYVAPKCQSKSVAKIAGNMTLLV